MATSWGFKSPRPHDNNKLASPIMLSPVACQAGCTWCKPDPEYGSPAPRKRVGGHPAFGTPGGPGWLPGAVRGAVASEDFGAVGVAGGGGTVGVVGDGPAQSVDHDLVVERAI